MKVKEICDYLLSLYPTCLASSFDLGKIGLQFGDKEDEVKKVIICLDATEQVIDEAIKEGANLIISHHPFMFNPLINLDYHSPLFNKLYKLFTNHISVFAMHTNFDAGLPGMNDFLSLHLGIALDEKLDACPDDILRVGSIEETSLMVLAKRIKEIFNFDGLRVVGDLNKKINRVGIVGGSGAVYLRDALKKNCDVLITGEIRHNNALDALDEGIALIEVPHAIEASFKEDVAKLLKDKFNDLLIIESKVIADPFKVL